MPITFDLNFIQKIANRLVRKFNEVCKNLNVMKNLMIQI